MNTNFISIPSITVLMPLNIWNPNIPSFFLFFKYMRNYLSGIKMLQLLFHVFPKFSIECYRHNLQVFGCENDKITLFEATCSHQPLYLRVISIICLKFNIGGVIIQVTIERVIFACFSNGCMSIFIKDTSLL